MSIQTTTDISREDAENRYIERGVKLYRKFISSLVKEMSDEELEDILEEKFFNYNIID
jgi:hypothetical protein